MNIGQLIASLGVDTSGLFLAQKEMENLKKKTEDATASMNKNLKEVGNTMMDVGKKMTLFVTTPILAAGAAAFKMASDYNESLNKVQVAFGKNSKEVENWSKTTLGSIGLANKSALEMASLFGDMSTSMGLGTAQSAKMSMSLVQLAGDLASFKNIGIEQAQTSLAGVFTGETESLKRLGIVMTETNIQQFAYTQGITKKVESLSQAEKVMLRYNYIMSVTKNSQGDFARTSEGAANQMRTFTESLQQAGVLFGQVILPTVTKWITKLNEMLMWIQNLTEGQKKWVIGIAAVVAIVGPLLTGLGFLIANVFPLLITGGTAVVAMFTALKVAIASNPIMAVALLIGTLAASMLLLRNNTSGATDAQKKFNDELKKTQGRDDTFASIDDRVAVMDKMNKDQLETLKSDIQSNLSAEKDRTLSLNMELTKRLAADKTFNQAKAEAARTGAAFWTKQAEDRKIAIQQELAQETTKNESMIRVQERYLQMVDRKIGKQPGEKQAAAFDPEKMNAVADIMKKVAEGEKSISAVSSLFNRDISTTGIEFNKTEDKIKLYSEAIKSLTGVVSAGDPVLKGYVAKLNSLRGDFGPMQKKYFQSKDGTFAGGGAFNAEGKNQVSSSMGGILSGPIAGLGAGAYAGAAGSGMNAVKAGATAQAFQEKMQVVADKTAMYGQQAQGLIQSYSSLVQANTAKQLEMVDKVAKAQGKSAEWVAKEKERIQAASSKKMKAAAIAEAMINIAIGATKALTLPFPFNLLAMATVVGAGALQIATINAQKMASGGVIPPGYSNDTYPALLSSGETVVPPGKLPAMAGEKEFKLLRVNVAGRDLEYVYQEQRKLQASY